MHSIDDHEETALMLPKNRPPTPPGEMLVEEFLKPAGITQTAFAERIGMSLQQLNPILRGKHAISARVAILFGRALGTSPEFWLNLQTKVDLWNALRATPAPRFSAIVPTRPHRVAAKARRARSSS